MSAIADVYTSIGFLEGRVSTLGAWHLVVHASETIHVRSDAMTRPPEFSRDSRLAVPGRVERLHDTRMSVWLSVDADQCNAIFAALEQSQDVISATLFLVDPATEEETRIVSGTLLSADSADGEVTLEFAESPPNAGRAVCRDASAIAGLSHLAPRTFLPVVFGRNEYAAVPLFRTASAILAEDLAIDDEVAVLRAAVDWAAPAYIQIGDEVIRADAIDGVQLGGDAEPLVRASPRLHRRGSRVIFIGADLPRWCAADHAAEVLSVRADGQGNPELSGYTASEETLGGFTATIIEGAQLPLLVTTSRAVTMRESERDVGQWALLEDSDAYSPLDAFRVGLPGRSGLLTQYQRILAASFMLPAASNDGRFDELRRAWLSFQYSQTRSWKPTTCIAVTVSQGEAVYTRSIFAWATVTIPLEAETELPGGDKAIETTITRLAFQNVVPTGAWTKPERAIDSLFQDPASIDTGAAADLAATFVEPPEAPAGTVDVVRLKARVHNDGESDVTVRLRIAVAGALNEYDDTAVVSDEWQTLTLALADPEVSGAGELIGGDAVYTLELPSGGAVDVDEMWLEIETSVELDFPASLSVETLSTTGEIYIPPTFHLVELDITELLGADPWDLFSSEEAPVEVRFEVVDPPDDIYWNLDLVDVHWKWEVNAATSVRATDRLWIDADGFDTGESGDANPAEVIRRLLTEEQFGNAEVDGDSFDAAATRVAAMGLGFRRVIAEDERLGEAIGRAEAESMCVVSNSPDAWSIDIVPLMVETAPIAAPSAAEQIDEAIAVRAARRDVAPGIPGLKRNGEWLTAAGGTVLDVRWISAGAETLLLHLANRTGANAIRAEFPLLTNWLNARPGAVLGVAVDESLLRAGEVESVSFSSGRLMLQIADTRTLEVAPIIGLGSIRRAVHSGDLYYFSGDTCVAMLTALGDLLIVGDVEEEALTAVERSSVYTVDAETGALGLNFTNGVGGDANTEFTADGDLRTSVPILENEDTGESAPGNTGEMREGSSVAGGLTVANMELTATALRIRGQIRTGQILQEVL